MSCRDRGLPSLCQPVRLMISLDMVSEPEVRPRLSCHSLRKSALELSAIKNSMFLPFRLASMSRGQRLPFQNQPHSY